MEVDHTEILKRRLRRGSSLYNSTSLQSDSATNASNLIYAAQLNNEKLRWIEFQQNVLNQKKKPKVPIKGDVNMFTPDLTNYCNLATNMDKFAADTKEFLVKTFIYANMEKYHREKFTYVEKMLKENIDEITTKTLNDQIVEKIHLK